MKENGASEGPDGPTPLILICNDDGIHAPGIKALAEAMDGLGELHVVAPQEEQSGVSQAITIRHPVRVKDVPFEVASGPIQAFAVSGTPADCVKLAVDQLLPRKPDLVVSGINQGPNAAINVMYSGTVSAALEASILGIDAVAFSLCAWLGGDYAPSQVFARKIAATVLEEGLPAGVLLNVNIPNLPLDEIRGVSVTRQAKSRWEEAFVERKDPFDQTYYWLTGTFVNLDEMDHTDYAAIEQGYVSVTPVQHDLTAYHFIETLQSWGIHSVKEVD